MKFGGRSDDDGEHVVVSLLFRTKPLVEFSAYANSTFSFAKESALCFVGLIFRPDRLDANAVLGEMSNEFENGHYQTND